MSIKFGNKDLERYARDYKKHVVAEVKRVVQETAMLIQAEARALAPVDEGNLRGSIEMNIRDGGLVATVLVSAHYGIYVEFGTGVFATKGSRAKQIPWRFYSTKLNRWVTMSGIKPQPYWYPAVEKGKAFFEREMRKVVG